MPVHKLWSPSSCKPLRSARRERYFEVHTRTKRECCSSLASRLCVRVKKKFFSASCCCTLDFAFCLAKRRKCFHRQSLIDKRRLQCRCARSAHDSRASIAPPSLNVHHSLWRETKKKNWQKEDKADASRRCSTY